MLDDGSSKTQHDLRKHLKEVSKFIGSIPEVSIHGIPSYIYIPGTQMPLVFKVLTHKIEG
jgi:hypothetical protein